MVLCDVILYFSVCMYVRTYVCMYVCMQGWYRATRQLGQLCFAPCALSARRQVSLRHHPSSPTWHRKLRAIRAKARRRLRSARASGSRPLVRDLVVLSNHHAVYQELPWVEVRITKDNGLNNGTATLDGHRHHGIPSAMGRTSNPRPVARRNRRTRDRLSFRSRRWKSPTSPALLRQDVLRMLWQWVESGTEKSDLAKSVQKMAFARLRKGEGEKEALEGKLVELQMKENFMERTLPLLVQDQSQSRGHAGATASEG